MQTEPSLIWKFDNQGNERPIQEQLDRRRADLEIALQHLAWYSKYPLNRDPMQQAAAHTRRLKHVQSIQSDIYKLELKCKQKNNAL